MMMFPVIYCHGLLSHHQSGKEKSNDHLTDLDSESSGSVICAITDTSGVRSLTIYGHCFVFLHNNAAHSRHNYAGFLTKHDNDLRICSQSELFFGSISVCTLACLVPFIA
jgi:hypothetical protein